MSYAVKIIRIIQKYRNAQEEEIKNFIYKNMAQEMINGLEYDDPKTIKRALKLFGINHELEETEPKEETALS